MARWWKDRDKLVPGDPGELPRHDRDSDDDGQIPTEDIGDVNDELDDFDDTDLPDRGVDP